MQYEWYAHRFADIILNSDYALKQEVEEFIQSISFDAVLEKFEKENELRRASGTKEMKGKQSTINTMFKEEFGQRGWC